MRVQRVVMPDSGVVSYTVLDGEFTPVDPIEAYLGYLTDVERSPNTIRAYAHDLRDFFAYLEVKGLDWRSVTAEALAGFVSWLRLPPQARTGEVATLPSAVHRCSAATVNRKLSALCGFYEHHARRGVDVAAVLSVWRPDRGERSQATSWKPFLTHAARGTAQPRRAVKLRAVAERPRTLDDEQVRALLDACQRRRDRLLLMLLHRGGLRIGEALGLRHSDIIAAEREIRVVPRDNDNGARVKGWHARTVPVGPEVVRSYADYLHEEYGDLDSDYVFVNLWGQPRGHPLSYGTVYDLVVRLRRRTGVAFEPHMLRHTYATGLLRRGTPVEVVSKLLGHASIATTVDTYGHLTVGDARQALVDAGHLPAQGSSHD